MCVHFTFYPNKCVLFSFTATETNLKMELPIKHYQSIAFIITIYLLNIHLPSTQAAFESPIPIISNEGEGEAPGIQPPICPTCCPRAEIGPAGAAGIPGIPGPPGIPGNHGNNGNNGHPGGPGTILNVISRMKCSHISVYGNIFWKKSFVKLLQTNDHKKQCGS